MSSEQNLDLARRYLQALERFATGDELAAFFASDVVQREFPNRLVPQGATRGLDELLAGAERGKQLLSAQTFDVEHAVAVGEHVALEVAWTGTLAVPVAGLSAGDQLRARLGVFLDFEHAKIKSQRNYDCYEPW